LLAFDDDDEVLLNSDSAENGLDFNSCLRTEEGLPVVTDDPLPVNPSGWDIDDDDIPSRFIESPIRLMLEADE